MLKTSKATARGLAVVGLLVLTAGLYVSSLYSHVLFHAAAGLFGILVACGIVVIARHSRRLGDLKRTQAHLRRVKDALEDRVKQRTAELTETVEKLEKEIRQRTLTEDKLEDERRRLFAVLQMLPGYVSLRNRDYSFRFANDTFLDLFGNAGDTRCYRLLKGLDAPCNACPVMRVFETQEPAEWQWQSPNDRSFHVWAYPFADTDGAQLVLELGIDVTDLKRLQAEVLRISEAERQSFGQDLHDSLGSSLSGIACMSQVLRRKLTARSLVEADEAERIELLLAESVNLTRSLAQGLRPVGLEADGLMAAMKELASGIESLFDVRCAFRCDRPVLVDDSMVATHLYRIAQEASSNAVRHGKAANITIELTSSGGTLTLAIEDDGVGLPQPPDMGAGMGLRIMRYRANTIGGALRVEQRPGGGTAVVCQWKQSSWRSDVHDHGKSDGRENQGVDRRRPSDHAPGPHPAPGAGSRPGGLR